MVEHKFKIGDYVEILDGSKIENYTGGWCMPNYIGEVRKVINFFTYYSDNRIAYELEGSSLKWDERGLKLKKVLPSNSFEIFKKEYKKMKFKVGDKVIGNKEANLHYGITREGWIGEVTKTYDNGNIKVRGTDRFDNIADYEVKEECFDLYTGKIRKSHKLRFETTEGERYVSHGKHKGETIPTITTTAYDDTMGNSGSATCDKADYNERQGIIEAVANMTYGNFDREYNKFLNHQKEVENALCKCKTCGKIFKTKEEARACEAEHVERKKAKCENYLMRKAAKKRAREMQIEQMAKDIIAAESKQ